jgi:hypothetical protein
LEAGFIGYDNFRHTFAYSRSGYLLVVRSRRCSLKEFCYVVKIPHPSDEEVRTGAKAPQWGGKIGPPDKVKAGIGSDGRLAGGIVYAKDEAEARMRIKDLHGAEAAVTSLECRIGFQEL